MQMYLTTYFLLKWANLSLTGFSLYNE